MRKNTKIIYRIGVTISFVLFAISLVQILRKDPTVTKEFWVQIISTLIFAYLLWFFFPDIEDYLNKKFPIKSKNEGD